MSAALFCRGPQKKYVCRTFLPRSAEILPRFLPRLIDLILSSYIPMFYVDTQHGVDVQYSVRGGSRPHRRKLHPCRNTDRWGGGCLEPEGSSDFGVVQICQQSVGSTAHAGERSHVDHFDCSQSPEVREHPPQKGRCSDTEAPGIYSRGRLSRRGPPVCPGPRADFPLKNTHPLLSSLTSF